MCLKLYMYVCWAVWIYVYRVDFVKVFSLDSPSVSNALHPLDTHSIPMGVSREGCYVYKNSQVKQQRYVFARYLIWKKCSLFDKLLKGRKSCSLVQYVDYNKGR